MASEGFVELKFDIWDGKEGKSQTVEAFGNTFTVGMAQIKGPFMSNGVYDFTCIQVRWDPKTAKFGMYSVFASAGGWIQSFRGIFYTDEKGGSDHPTEARWTKDTLCVRLYKGYPSKADIAFGKRPRRADDPPTPRSAT